jgi:hypothetical protein
MNVFLSWSGTKSHAVAKVLEKYLPSHINKVRPWLSSKEISAGARWSAAIAENLEAANVGIICLTAENQREPWILFEAGAISKLTAVGRAIVLRVGLKTSDVTGPLSQFQSVATDKDGFWKLLTDINNSEAGPLSEDSLKITFDGLWSQIEAELKEIESRKSRENPPERTSDEMLREILDLIRHQHMDSQDLLLNLRMAEDSRAANGTNLLEKWYLSTAPLTTPQRPFKMSLNQMAAKLEEFHQLYKTFVEVPQPRDPNEIELD